MIELLQLQQPGCGSARGGRPQFSRDLDLNTKYVDFTHCARYEGGRWPSNVTTLGGSVQNVDESISEVSDRDRLLSSPPSVCAT